MRTEKAQGKGNVVRRMFADVEADIYVLADGDGTYEANAAPQMIEELIANHLDMVVGIRKTNSATTAYPSGHTWGNRMFNKLFRFTFQTSSPTFFLATVAFPGDL